MATPPPPVSSLRAHLLSSLKCLPGSRVFHLHVLVSSPRKPGQSLYLYASPRPKCLVQDILVLLSEQIPARAEQGLFSATPSTQDVTSNLTPRIFVSAIEASVYEFAPSNSTILYISKVDGTGQGAHPSPTSTLSRAFLTFYTSPRSPLYPTLAIRHVWIHLFARSQRQYLFPNSADHPDKKPLGDVALCRWWKKIISDVAKAVKRTDCIKDTGDSDSLNLRTPNQSIHLYYILPGQSEIEASYLLRESQTSSPSSSSAVDWIYSHPYNPHADMDLPHPSSSHPTFVSTGQGHAPLASLIPHFEDDPKSRFLDELAATSEEQAVAIPVPTPKRKRPKIGEGEEINNSTLTRDDTGTFEDANKLEPTDTTSRLYLKTEETDASCSKIPSLPAIMYNPPSSSPPPVAEHSPLLRPSTPEPMGSQLHPLLSPRTPNFPTFPTTLLSSHTSPDSSQTGSRLQPFTPHASPRTPMTPRTPHRPKSDLDVVSPDEFWERMSYRQECAMGAVTGFFVAIFSQRDATANNDCADLSHPQLTSTTRVLNTDTTESNPLTLISEGTVPHSVIKRVMSSLLTGVEFSTQERAHRGTQVIETAIKGLCEGLGQLNEGTKERHAQRAESPISEMGDKQFEIYSSQVYASLSVSNPPLTPRLSGSTSNVAENMTACVNVLGVRRKKKIK